MKHKSAGKMLLLVLGVAIKATVAQQVLSESSQTTKLTLANNDFSWKLHKSFPLKQNVFYSPFSIFTALGMLYKGARGRTAEEMRQALSYGVAQLNDDVHQHFRELLNLVRAGSSEYTLDIANAVISSSRFPILDAYKDELRNFYGALAEVVDFVREKQAALAKINDWASAKTHGKIPTIVEDLDSLTVFVLLNAVYFKGTWKTQFDPKNTRKRTFYNDGLNAAPVDMMNVEESFLYRRHSEKGFDVLKLPYKGEHVSMVMILPLARDGLQAVEESLTAQDLSEITSGMWKTKVRVSIPKFKLRDSKELKGTLQGLGMESAFERYANFSGIDGEGKIYVSKVLHKAFVEVNEEGSEAAAVTAIVGIRITSAVIPPTPVFRADHPFLFIIREERTGIILFFGRVNRL